MNAEDSAAQLRKALAEFPVEAFRTVAGAGEATLEIKKSEFIGVIAPATTEEEARRIIDEQKQLHPKARHWCTAYVLGPDARTQRSNDDGEPAGTAGAPILDVLGGSGLTDVVAVVTRYFGGVLLGAGGLVRAYGSAASEALARTTIITRNLIVPVSARLDYSTADTVRARAEQRGWKIIDAEYAADVTMHAGVPADDVDDYARMLADISAGSAQPIIGTPRYV